MENDISTFIRHGLVSATQAFKFKQKIRIRFDMEHVALWYFSEPKVSDMPIVDMLLDSLGRHHVSKLDIYADVNEQQIFSSEALRSFLLGSSMLKDLKVRGLRLDADACDAVGRIPEGLDSLEIVSCKLLNALQFSNGVRTNVCGPKSLKLLECLRNLETGFSSIAVRLLQSPNLKILVIEEHSTSISDLDAFKAACKCNQSLEELRISDMFFLDLHEPNLFYQGIALIPNLRTFKMYYDGVYSEASPQKHGEMLANALIAHHNESLESVGILAVHKNNSDSFLVGNREIDLILQFNCERLGYQKRAHGDSRERMEQLVDALVAADTMGNHHLQFWLVRDNAGDLFCGSVGSKTTQGRKRRRQSDTK
jgi:hypothetical protein